MSFQSILHHHRTFSQLVQKSRWRAYATGTQHTKQRSPHAQWYADIVPAMIPIALLGSAVYLSLQLAQLTLSHEKFLDEANARVKALEAELEMLRTRLVLPEAHSTPSNKRSRWWWF